MLKLKELTLQVKERMEHNIDFSEVLLSNSIKNELTELIYKESNKNVFFIERTFYIETSPKHYAIVPNQYFSLAKECYSLVIRLRYLFDFIDKEIRPNSELRRTLNAFQDDFSNQNVTNLEKIFSELNFSLLDNRVNKEDFFYLISNFNKKFGNLKENTLRASEDLLGAYVLNIVPLTTAASGFFGSLVYYLSANVDIYKKLCNDISIVNLRNSISDNYISNPFQIIYYGVPGSGKSHKIDEETKGISDEQKMRVVFHPEYTNADFVGQILPVQTNEGLEYPFKAGPFSRILKRALENPDKPYYLIIEEINRGNAAAIFGDLFQLLDRYSNGWSAYSIENLDINAFIRSEDERYSEKNPPKTKKVGNIEFTENTSLRLPPNLSLYATMNTSDQNVFTLDNAFQRRWDMKLVENKFEGDDAESQRNAEIGGSEVTWEQFQTHINKKISEMSSSMGMSSMEDKRLGCWFVKAEDNKISKDKFAEKVLKYLWDDAFKFSREEIFDIKDKTSSLESIVSDFKNGDETAPCNWNIFKDTSFIQQQNNSQSESDIGETE